MAIDECMDVRRQFQSRSHSFGSFGASPPTVMAIFPSFVMSIRTFSTPAARTARIARVMSACRNVEGARAMGLPLRSLLIGRQIEAVALAVQPDQLAADRVLLLQTVRWQAAALGAEGGISEALILVRTPFAAISPISIRASVRTRMAVGQVAVFRPVRSVFLHASKIISCAHFIGTCTLARFGSAGLVERGVVLTRTIDVPGFL